MWPSRGESADGHDFVGAAFDRGAVLALVEREVADAAGTNYPAVVVEDAVLAMGALAAESVRRIRARRAAAGAAFTVIGITGSAGKTTTKDLLAGIFAAAGAEGTTVAPQGSYNGEVGVPLTVFKADYDTRYLVIEMGATGVGHIQYLADMVQPEIGVVLGVGSAHAGEFGGVDNIAVAKGELVEALPAGGTAVLNLDDARVAAMAARTRARVLGYTSGPAGIGQDNSGQTDVAQADVVRAEGVELNADGHPEFDLPARRRSASRDNRAPRHREADRGPPHRQPPRRCRRRARGRHPGRPDRGLPQRPDRRQPLADGAHGAPRRRDRHQRRLQRQPGVHAGGAADAGRTGPSGRRTWAVLGAMLELGRIPSASTWPSAPRWCA